MKNILVYLLLFSAVMLLINGCMSEKKAVGYLQKTGQLPRVCADLYPPVVIMGEPIRKSDTVYTPGETIPCPPAKIDTVTGEPEIVYVKCPPSKIVTDSITQHDTVVDIARITAQRIEIDSLRIVLAVSKAEENKARKQANTRLFILIGAGAVLAAGFVLKLKSII